MTTLTNYNSGTYQTSISSGLFPTTTTVGTLYSTKGINYEWMGDRWSSAGSEAILKSQNILDGGNANSMFNGSVDISWDGGNA